jgi:hypothetical protein
MLTKADDYPIHQRPEPIAYAGGHRNFYDRYFFNGYAQDGELFFAAALGVYPALNVIDAAFSVIHDGRQHNVYASRVLNMERLDTRVGPIEVDVIEPLRVLRVRVDDKASGIVADVRFNARVEAMEEPRFTRRSGAQLAMDLTRLTQNGTYEGSITAQGRRFAIRPDVHSGTRDRSWGIRGIGARDPQPNPLAEAPQFYWLWAPLNFPNRAAFYHLNSDADGEPWNTRGVLSPLLGRGAAIEADEATSVLAFKSGTRHAARARIDYVRKGTRLATAELTPLYHFYMKGIGYGHPKWSHGSYHGELEVGHDEITLADAAPSDPSNLHIQAICKAQLESNDGTESGIGVLEQMIIGPHKPSGFKAMFDMAP